MDGHIKSLDYRTGGGVILTSSGLEVPFRERAIIDRRWIPQIGQAVTFDLVSEGLRPLAVWIVPGIRWRAHGST
jgi:hypothetical protein